MKTSDVDNTRALRGALGVFLTGITVIATLDKHGTPRGFTANSFSSVSLSPPLVSVCVSMDAESNKVFTEADGFSINILSESQRDISNLFASKRADKFLCSKWIHGYLRNPILSDVAAWFECRQYKTVVAGDHVILVGEVVKFHSTDRCPLGYYGGNYFSPDFLPLAANQEEKKKTTVGAIVRFDEKILFLSDDDGTWRLPTATSAATLRQMIAAWGLRVDWGFLFAVFEGDEGHSIYYHAQITDDSALLAGVIPKAHFVPVADIADEKFANDATAAMMRRYRTERQRGTFGVYVGDDAEGDVRTVNK